MFVLVGPGDTSEDYYLQYGLEFDNFVSSPKSNLLSIQVSHHHINELVMFKSTWQENSRKMIL